MRGGRGYIVIDKRATYQLFVPQSRPHPPQKTPALRARHLVDTIYALPIVSGSTGLRRVASCTRTVSLAFLLVMPLTRVRTFPTSKTEIGVSAETTGQTLGSTHGRETLKTFGVGQECKDQWFLVEWSGVGGVGRKCGILRLVA